MSMTARRSTGVDGPLFKQALLGSLKWLAANHEEVNRLNVFPVPDGDTGTNMLLTLQSAVEDVKESNAAEVSKIAKLASHGSLMGARGNSGVILSQIFRGFARAVEGKSSLTPREVAGALEEAANAAYRAVNRPTEGTILTVAREAGRSASAAASDPEATVPSVIAAAAAGARAAVLKTPSQLQILRDAGVVDAGGFGLQIILEGMLKTMEEATALSVELTAAKPRAAQTALELPEGGWGYCTEFLIEGTDLDVDVIRDEIEALGNSVLVVGEPELVKVHVHTDEPTRVINLLSRPRRRCDRGRWTDHESQHAGHAQRHRVGSLRRRCAAAQQRKRHPGREAGPVTDKKERARDRDPQRPPGCRCSRRLPPGSKRCGEPCRDEG